MKNKKITTITLNNWSDFNEKTQTRKVDLIIGEKKCGRLTLNELQFNFLNQVLRAGVLNYSD